MSKPSLRASRRFSTPVATRTTSAASAIQPKRRVVTRRTRSRVSRSSMARSEGIVARNRKNCGPTQTVAATRWSQRLTCSTLEEVPARDGLVALRADRDQADRSAENLFDAVDVIARRWGQVLEAAHAG